MFYGAPTKNDIILSVQRTDTHSFIPEGWEWK